MRVVRLSRRTVLRGAGSIAIALPWLEAMTPVRPSFAAAAPARRFLAVYNPGGTVLERWRPTGTETDFTLSPILAPFESVKDRILVLDGIDMKSAVGEQDQAGMVAWLTGTEQGIAGEFAKGPSIDQVLAGSISAGRRFGSSSLAVRWGTGKGHGLVHPSDIVNYADDATFTPQKPHLDPQAIFQELFGSFEADDEAWDRSILDALDRRYAKLSARLGAADRERIEQHLTQIRELEQTLGSLSRCRVPALVDTSGYDPDAGLESSDDGSVRHPETDAMIPVVGKLMADMLVMAFACDLTAVGTLQWSDCESKHTFPWLGLMEHHEFYQNAGGYRPAELEIIANWYSEQHAYLLQQMAGVDMGGHSLLDESVVFFGSHLQHPATHLKNDMPFVLGGGGGGLRTGRFVSYDHPSHNDLLVSLFNLFGDARETFGAEEHSTGPLSGLV